MMPCPAESYRLRRAKVAAPLTRPFVVFAGRARLRNPANALAFRADSNYLYLGGPSLEGAAWLIEPGSDGTSGCVLIRLPTTVEDAVWTGETASDGALALAAGIPVSGLASPNELATHLKGREAAAIIPPCPATLEWARTLGLKAPRPEEVIPLIEQRLIKDQRELEAMRRAAKVSVEIHLAAMRHTKPGESEAGVAAKLIETSISHQCAPSFTAAVTVHGEVLHSEGYRNLLKAGQLLLVDAGAEEPGGYASDITRTYPVSGTFSGIQRDLYDTVLRAERAAIDACVPGARYRDVHDLAGSVICEGLVATGLLKGNPKELAIRYAHTLFFTHGVGHLIGLDVHDMEDFGDLAGYAAGRTRRTEFGNKFLRLDRDLQPGMTVTIEPGIYLVPAIWRNEAMWEPFKDVVCLDKVETLLKSSFGGIRIEDTIHIREHRGAGPEMFTDGLPKDADEVCAVVGSARN